MTLHQLLAEPRWVRGAGGGDAEALRAALRGLPGESALSEAVRLGETGESIRHGAIGGRTGILDLGREAGGPGLALGLPSSSATGGQGEVTWIVWGLERPAVNLFLAPALRGFASAVRAGARDGDLAPVFDSPGFRETEIVTDVRVAHVLTPLSYRVYPDTPVSEVQNLMLRRGVSAVPVVGESLEVMGLITASDILPHAVPGALGPVRVRAAAAREVMTRSVFCVSDAESIVEAGRALVARNVAQLPVVREGEIVGFLERATVMRAFFAPSTEQPK